MYKVEGTRPAEGIEKVRCEVGGKARNAWAWDLSSYKNGGILYWPGKIALGPGMGEKAQPADLGMQKV